MKRSDPRVTPVRKDLNTAKIKPIRFTVKQPIIGVYRGPSKSSGMETQLVYGTAFDVYDVNGRWAWGQEIPIVGRAGYVGYVTLSALSQGHVVPDKRVKILRAPVFSKPDIKSAVRSLLPLNALVKVAGRVDKFLKIDGAGYVHASHCGGVKTGTRDFVAIAEQHFGLPYIWGGIGPDGLDCSGLVLSSLRTIGRAAPRDTDMQEKALGKSIKVTDKLSGLKRGDLVFWKGHVGIMTSSKSLLHANAFHMRVDEEPVKEASQRIKKTAGPITSIKRLSWF